MSCSRESALKHINQGIIFLNGRGISGHFGTKFTAVVLTEPILQMFEDLKIVHFLNPKEVYFLLTRVMCQKLRRRKIWVCTGGVPLPVPL